MSALAPVHEQVDLGFLCRKIRDAHDRVQQARGIVAKQSRFELEHARDAGHWLTIVKESLPYGDYLPWIEANLPFQKSTAANYAQVYHHWSLVSNAGSLRQALTRISEYVQWARNRTARHGLVYEQLELFEIPVEQWRRPARDPDYFAELSGAVHIAARFAQQDPEQIAAELGRRGEFRGAVAALIEFLPRLGAVLGRSATQGRP